MKNFKRSLFLVAFLGMGAMAQAGNSAHYFRVWQGFQRPELTTTQFKVGLVPFMSNTVDTYQGGALNNYIVVLPPPNKPEYLPDEFALVALTSKQAYDYIRSTPQGKSYGDSHWQLFDRNISKSVDPLVDYSVSPPTTLVSNTSYDMIGKPIDWSSGLSMVFIGLRKPTISKAEFMRRLQIHIETAKAVMQPKGLRGYILIANENYEIAYLNWPSQQAHDAAGRDADGKAVFTDANSFMDVLMYEPAKPFVAGQAVYAGEAYSTVQESEPRLAIDAGVERRATSIAVSCEVRNGDVGAFDLRIRGNYISVRAKNNREGVYTVDHVNVKSGNLQIVLTNSVDGPLAQDTLVLSQTGLRKLAQHEIQILKGMDYYSEQYNGTSSRYAMACKLTK